MKPARCRSCTAPIVWARTRAGKSMPLDRDPVVDGNVTVVGWDGAVAASTPIVVVGQLGLEDVPMSEWRYVSHFSTCPDAASHRRRRR